MNVAMPLAAATEQIVQALAGLKGDEVDFAALIEVAAEASGLSLQAENVERRRRLEPAPGQHERRRPQPVRGVAGAVADPGRRGSRPPVRSAAPAAAEQLAHPGQEPGAVGAVEDPVIAGQRQHGPSAGRRPRPASSTTARGLQRAHGQDRRLWRVDHGGEAVDPVHPEVGHRERAAAELGRRDRAVADAWRPARGAWRRSASATAGRRRRSSAPAAPSSAADRDPDVHP